MMEIESQNAARDIINVSGNLDLNGGSMTVQALYVNSAEQPIALPDQEALKTRFAISYLDFVVQEFDKKQVISRAILDDIKTILSSKNEIALVGVPGTGKTCLLVQLSHGISDVIYLSLNGKSLVMVLSHLINKINLRYDKALTAITDTQVGLEIFQSLLVISELTFLIDDCESNAEVIQKFLPLIKGKNTFIFASRTEGGFKTAGVTCFPVGAFTIEESKEFLKMNSIELELLSFNKLFEASKGNPLYLFYFSKFQLDPFPQDIDQFHEKIWDVLDSRQQECLIAVALSYQHINMRALTELLEFKYLTETVKFVNDLTVLTKSSVGELLIFHPAFREFVVAELDRNGLLDTYKLKFGEYFLKQEDFVQAAYHLMDTKPETIRDFALEVVPFIVNSGDLEFANRLLSNLLRNKLSKMEEGYIKYHLSSNYRLLNKNSESKNYLDQSLSLFKSARNSYWVSVASMNLAMNMVEDGDHENGLKLASSLLEKSKKYGAESKGQLLVNLSKIFVDLHEYEKSAAASKMAYEFFEQKNNIYGMISSLANLASSIAKMEDYNDIGEKYAEKLLSLSGKGISFHIELIALNILTSVNRQNKKYKLARDYGLRAVTVSQKYHLETKAILNLINYGNVLRDDNDLDEAIKIYHEALVQAINLELKREQSRIYWILSAIYSEKEEYTKSLEYIDLSITIAEEKFYNYGIAHGFEEKAAVLLRMGDKKNAAFCYAQSANTFKKIENFIKNYRRNLSKAIMLYYEVGAQKEANELMAASAKSFSGDGFIDLESILEAHDSCIDVHSYFHELGSNYVRSQSDHNLILEFLLYLEYCLKNVSSSKKAFNILLLSFCSDLSTNKFSKTILAILLEQSKSLVDTEDLKHIIKALGNSMRDFHSRNIEYEYVILCTLQNEFNFEFTFFEDTPLCQKLSLALILFLYASPDLIFLPKRNLEEKFCRVNIILKSDAEHVLKGVKIPAFTNPDLQTIHTGKRDYTAPEFIIVNDIYEQYADLAEIRNNKCGMFFLGAATKGIVSHFYHLKDSSKAFPKDITRKLAYFYDYTNIEDTKKKKLDYYIDLSKLEEFETK